MLVGEDLKRNLILLFYYVRICGNPENDIVISVEEEHVLCNSIRYCTPTPSIKFTLIKL